jgi:hypothetical protein
MALLPVPKPIEIATAAAPANASIFDVSYA